MDRVPFVALASGTGTLLQALLEATVDTDYPAEIVALVTDRAGTGAARRARAHHVDVHEVLPGDFADRAAWDLALVEAAQRHEPEWIISVGFMRILGPEFLKAFPQRILNTHPSLLPAFPGATPVRDAVEYGVKFTGCTVHVVDEGIDTGPVVAQRPIAVGEEDTADSLHDRIKSVERQLVVEVVDHIAIRGLQIDGRKAIIP